MLDFKVERIGFKVCRGYGWAYVQLNHTGLLNEALGPTMAGIMRHRQDWGLSLTGQPCPAYVVFAQSHKRNWRAGSTDANRALRMVDELCKEAPIDTNRIYLTGLSMGGYGTWSLAAAEPKRWAAIVPVCGGGNPADVAKFKDIPCWCFHGDKDTAVKVEKSREMIEALKKVESEPKYTEYPGVGHNSWDKAYGTPELFPWLFAQKRTELK